MIWTTKTSNTPRLTISYPFFEAENKREKKSALGMNSFYGNIIYEIEKHSDQHDFKYYIDITAEKTDIGIAVLFSLRARQRGRTVKSFSHQDLWKKGVIINQHTNKKSTS